MPSLRELNERRAYECRLTADRAVQTLDEAAAFLRDRGLLTRTTDSALPSLYAACHEQGYRPTGRGFASWPATKWPWFGALAGLPDSYALKVHRGKSLLVTAEAAALMDPICRYELQLAERGQTPAARLLRHLAEAGPSRPDELQTELGLSARDLRALRAPLERSGALASRSLRLDTAGGHVHTSAVARWDQVVPDSGREADPGALVVVALRAAVVAPEVEVLRAWFSWPRSITPAVVERLVDDGRITRPEPGWLSPA